MSLAGAAVKDVTGCQGVKQYAKIEVSCPYDCMSCIHLKLKTKAYFVLVAVQFPSDHAWHTNV